MKRSEMLKKITDHISEECGLDFPGMKPEYVAEEILDLIEKNGMQPPNICSSQVFPLSGIIDCAQHQYALWEPEE